MEPEFDYDDEFSDLYADVEVQAINALHHQNDGVSTSAVDAFTQLPRNGLERVDKEGNVLAETTRNGGEEDGLLKLLSEVEGNSEDDLEENVENETERRKGKYLSEERLEEDGVYVVKRKDMGPNSVAASSILKANCPAEALWENNHYFTMMEKVPLVRSRTSKHSPASHPLSFDLEKYGSVQISDSKEDNSQEVSECELDETAETPVGIEKGNSVEPESSQSDQSQHSPAVSCFSSPSTAVDNEKNRKHSKQYQSNFSSEKPEPVTSDYHRFDKCKSDDLKPISRGSRHRETTGRHPIRKELKQHKRSNYLKNSKTHLHENGGFDMMNTHYGMRPESSFTYFQGILPYRQVGPVYMENNFWNIYPTFGFGTGWYNGHYMNAGGCFLEKERPNIDNEDPDDNWYRNERRHANAGATQFNKKGHNMQLRRRMKGGDLSPLYEHNEEFMKGKFRRHTESINSDRDQADHRRDRYIPFDRKEIKSFVRGKRRCGSPLNPFNYSSQRENENKDPKYIKNHIESGRYGNSTNIAFDTSEDVRYCQQDDHLERRRHYNQSTNTCSSTTRSFNDHFDDKRKHHVLFEALCLHENENIEPRRQDDVLFQSGGRSNQIHRIRRDRYACDRASDHPNDREENKCTYKMKRKSYSSNQFDWSPNFLDPHDQHLRCQDSVDPRLVVHKKCNLQSLRKTIEAEDEVYHSSRRYNFKEMNNLQKFEDLKELNPAMRIRAMEGHHCDKSRHEKLCRNQSNEFLDIEEGQIITEEIVEKAMEACEAVKQSNDVEYSKAAINGSRVEKIDDERMKEIIAKMEKRRERFSEPITLKRDTEKSSKHLPGLVVETGEGKMGRPARKRRWNGS